MSDAHPLPAPAWLAIRLYLLVATIGAVISVPFLLFIGWFAWEFTKEEWPGNWLGWAFYVLFGVILVAGPFIGRMLFKRDRPVLALAVSAFSFLLAPLLVAGMLVG